MKALLRCRKGSLAAVFCLLLFAAQIAAAAEPLRIILDTDISTDADDAGAVAVLHGLAARGNIEILAMMVSSGDPYSVSCLSALNNYFGRPEIPIGKISGRSVRHDSAYTRAVALSAKMLDQTGQDAVALYRRLLARQPDRSVTIVSVGYLSNLNNLLRSGTDEYSALTGKELVGRKVKLLVCMGGEYPAGREWNFYQDARSSRYVVDQWPTRIVFAGFELGKNIITGKRLNELASDNPVRLSYLLHNDFQGRPSWDQLAVLYASEEAETREKNFVLSGPGFNIVKKDGSNQWDDNSRGNHFYLGLKTDAQEIARIIDTLMMQQ